MKRILRRLIACASILATLNLAVASSRAAEPANAPTATPKIVSARSALSTQELARYQQKSAQSQTAAHTRAAGAADNKAVWIVVGVVVVVGVVALAAGGGGGGGGGY